MVLNEDESDIGRKTIPELILLIPLVFLVGPDRLVWAWTEHPLVILETLACLPEVRDARPVRSESLDAFLGAEEKSLLAGEEAWARQNLAWYKPLPEALTFMATGNPGDIKERFCHAVRINPVARLGLSLQIVPGADPGGRPALTPASLTFLKSTADWKSTTFVALKAGELVSPLDIGN